LEAFYQSRGQGKQAQLGDTLKNVKSGDSHATLSKLHDFLQKKMQDLDKKKAELNGHLHTMGSMQEENTVETLPFALGKMFSLMNVAGELFCPAGLDKVKACKGVDMNAESPEATKELNEFITTNMLKDNIFSTSQRVSKKLSKKLWIRLRLLEKP